jgi:cell wall-associated NlpC family hydrolase
VSRAALAEAAEGLAGTRFRLHGRDPATGLDCVGVLAAAFAAIGRNAPLPTGYRLRSRDVPRLADIAEACGLVAASGPVEPGDVLLLRVAACQLHLAIAVQGGRFVHAHAGRKRVIAAAGPLAWPVVGRWRL